MPIYVYRCQDCGQRHEALVRDRRPEPTECPSCGQPQLQRIPAVIAAPVMADSSAATPPPGCGMGGCGSGACGFSPS